MKILISPAKQMKDEEIHIEAQSTPMFEDDARMLAGFLSSLDKKELGKVLDIKGRLLDESFLLYKSIDFCNGLRHAALPLFKGIQYNYMASDVFSDEEYSFLQEHLLILSALYGALRPLDGILPYRLEMKSRLNFPGHMDLYGYWAERVAKKLDCSPILNLASDEYSKMVLPYLKKDMEVIKVSFYEKGKNGLVEKGVHVKMLRGMLVRFIACNRITDIKGVMEFLPPGFVLKKDAKSEKEIVFIKKDAL